MPLSHHIAALCTVLAIALGLQCSVVVHAGAAELRIALAASVTALDPQYHRYTPNITVASHVFDTLLTLDRQHQVQPGLATAWRMVDDATIELALRGGVRFHSGRPFTAEDVAASLRRAARPTDSPYSYAQAVAAVTRVEVIDSLHLRLHTDGPAPTLLRDLAMVSVLPATLEHTSAEDLVTPEMLDGTGPYRLVSWRPGESIRLVAVPDSWHGPQQWDEVELREIISDARRVTALTSGAVDMIEQVPPADAIRLAANADVHVVSGPSTRVLYLGMDVARTVSPQISGPHGERLSVNPFQDLRVRRAISLAIDRHALVGEVLLGQGLAAGQVLAPSVFGADPDIDAPAVDLEAARALMAEAGWAEGFTVPLACTRDRYAADIAVARTVTLALRRIGIRSTAQCENAEVFFPRASRQEFSLWQAGIASGSGDGLPLLLGLLNTPEPARQRGQLNRGGWSDPQFDALLDAASGTVDGAERLALLRQAVDRATAQIPVVPLHVQNAVWAMRRDLDYPVRPDELTLAMEVTPR